MSDLPARQFTLLRLLAVITGVGATLALVRWAAAAGIVDVVAACATFAILSACGFFSTVILALPFDPELTPVMRQKIRRWSLSWLFVLVQWLIYLLAAVWLVLRTTRSAL